MGRAARTSGLVWGEAVLRLSPGRPIRTALLAHSRQDSVSKTDTRGRISHPEDSFALGSEVVNAETYFRLAI